MPVTPHKIQGFKSQFSFTPAGGALVQFKSLQEFELNIKGDTLDCSDHDSAGWKDYLTGMLDWDGTIKGCYVEGDATQVDIFTALTTQATLPGVFYPEKVSGQVSYSGNFTVTGYKHGGKQNDIQTLDITIKGRGPLTQVAQA